jgi:phosphoglycolate phosphatase-like HAD superfamily hydrolase
MNNRVVYVFDFDGVICESAMETAITGWKAARQIWGDMPDIVPQEKIEQFRLVRPIIETGFEAILTMRLLYLDEPIDAIRKGYGQKFKELKDGAKLTDDCLKHLFGDTRDAWIAQDQDDWVRKNPLYDGVVTRLQELGRSHSWYIVTTKHERFVRLILQANKIELADDQLFGLDRNMTKVEVLKRLSQGHPDETIYFVEDRLPTLMNVMNFNELTDVKLFFSLWGFNTDEDKALAANESITSLQLKDFLEF